LASPSEKLDVFPRPKTLKVFPPIRKFDACVFSASGEFRTVDGHRSDAPRFKPDASGECQPTN
jgi:hypothetical protein